MLPLKEWLIVSVVPPARLNCIKRVPETWLPCMFMLALTLSDSLTSTTLLLREMDETPCWAEARVESAVETIRSQRGVEKREVFIAGKEIDGRWAEWASN